jgi:hypothetical protein
LLWRGSIYFSWQSRRSPCSAHSPALLPFTSRPAIRLGAPSSEARCQPSRHTFTAFGVFFGIMSAWFDFLLVAAGLAVLFGVVALQQVL